MSDSAIVLVSLAVLGFGAVSGLLRRTPISSAMVFVGIGLVLGSEGFHWLGDAVTPTGLEVVTNTTLVMVLFSDAAQLDTRALRRESAVPARLLGIGLPLTIALGTVVAMFVLPSMAWAEALVLAIILAPTDAALGQAVVVDERLPSRVRQGLNVESGLNDGICVPLLAVALAIADVTESGGESGSVISQLLRVVGLGVVAGVVAGGLAALVVRSAGARGWILPLWRPLVVLASAGLAYGIAVELEGSGFVAAFVAGLTFRILFGPRAPAEVELGEEASSLLGALTFLMFGAVVLGPLLHDMSWQVVVYGVLSLTIIRMAPVALSLLGAGLSRPTVLLMGWFGPRGLASIVFALIALREVELPQGHLISQVAAITVALSVVLHGATAVPLVNAYVRGLPPDPTGSFAAEPSGGV